eukprot:gene12648-biopygen11015
MPLEICEVRGGTPCVFHFRKIPRPGPEPVGPAQSQRARPRDRGGGAQAITRIRDALPSRPPGMALVCGSATLHAASARPPCVRLGGGFAKNQFWVCVGPRKKEFVLPEMAVFYPSRSCTAEQQPRTRPFETAGGGAHPGLYPLPAVTSCSPSLHCGIALPISGEPPSHAPRVSGWCTARGVGGGCCFG